MSRYTMRRARPGDLDSVMALLRARIDWLREQGSDQWSTRDFLPLMQRAVANGETWLLHEHQHAVGTLSITTVGDADFWAPHELDQPAFYLSKLATDPAAAGRGIGALLMRWAHAYAHRRGVPRLRWDVWRTNRDLQRYYATLGVEPLRIVTVPGRWSGVLYEQAFQKPDPPAQVIDDTRERVVAELPSRVVKPLSRGDGMAFLESDPAPDHWHVVSGLWTTPLGMADGDGQQELTVPALNTDRTLIYNAGSGWRVNWIFSHPVIAWDSMPQLVAGQVYHVRHHQPDDGACGVQVTGDDIPYGETAVTHASTPQLGGHL